MERCVLDGTQRVDSRVFTMTARPLRSVLACLPLAFACASPLPSPGGESSSTESTDATANGISGADTTAGSSSGPDTSTETDDPSGSSTSVGLTCGDGVIDEGEACDGTALPEDADCSTEGFGEGLPGCLADCSTIDYTSCPLYMLCGNREVGFGEECDGEVFGGGIESCDDFPNLTGKGLACTEDCMLDTSACMTCRESGESCSQEDTCCNVDESCGGSLGPRCCVLDGLGMCTN